MCGCNSALSMQQLVKHLSKENGKNSALDVRSNGTACRYCKSSICMPSGNFPPDTLSYGNTPPARPSIAWPGQSTQFGCESRNAKYTTSPCHQQDRSALGGICRRCRLYFFAAPFRLDAAPAGQSGLSDYLAACGHGDGCVHPLALPMATGVQAIKRRVSASAGPGGRLYLAGRGCGCGVSGDAEQMFSLVIRRAMDKAGRAAASRPALLAVVVRSAFLGSKFTAIRPRPPV